MKITVLGTGMVGRTVGGKLIEAGHDVCHGTRDVAATLARSDTDAQGNQPFSKWKDANPGVKLGSFAEAAGHGDIVFNATSGLSSIKALKATGTDNIDGKILIDLANPLDFSQGFPPSLSVCNHEGAKEQVRGILVEDFGWKSENITDLGDITTARGAEMILPLWVRLYGTFQHPNFNIQVKTGSAS